MDHGGEALIGLVGAHGDAFELLELAEEILDEMAPLVHLLVDGEQSDLGSLDANRADEVIE
jgi:hypothetical protein